MAAFQYSVCIREKGEAISKPQVLGSIKYLAVNISIYQSNNRSFCLENPFLKSFRSLYIFIYAQKMVCTFKYRNIWKQK